MGEEFNCLVVKVVLSLRLQNENGGGNKRDDLTVNDSQQPPVLDFDHIHQRYFAIQRKLFIQPLFYTSRQFNPMNHNGCPSSECSFSSTRPTRTTGRQQMNAEIENMHSLNIFKEVPRPSDKTIITLRWVLAANSRMGRSSSTRRH